MRLLYPLLLLFAFANLQAQTLNTIRVSAKLQEKIQAEPDAWHSVHIVLNDQVDFAALDAELTARRAPASERSQAVISAMKAKTEGRHKWMLEYFGQHPKVKPGSVKGYWLGNVIFAEMKKEAIGEASQWVNATKWIGLNGVLQLESFEEVAPPPVEPNGIEPGLAVINAPALWAMGYTGYGQIAFTNDTGIDPTHPALASRNRNFYVPKDHTWFEIDSVDFLPTGNFEPFDCGSHGTHVTGTILGLDRLNHDTTGVAFNAQFIGAPILCGIGTEDNVAAFQWSLDPDGDPATTDDMPDIINNSWYDPSLDTLDCYSVYVPVLEAMEAAGIAVIFSAGNAGPDPMTITQPHNININEVNAFTVGALNGNVGSLPIADFSSKGPSHCPSPDSSLLIKPEVSAPGQSVRSSIPGPDYAFFSGTSMAAPHVSGAILLLKEAYPDATGKELKLALYHTCTDLGAPGEDNTFGMGVINVLEAFNYLQGQGHVLVSPYRQYDILMVDMQTQPWACGNEVTASIVVENAGTDTIFSFEIVYEVDNVSASQTWTGTLAPRERVGLQLVPLTAPSGYHDLLVSVQLPNGVDDERPLNNRFRRPVFVTERTPFQADVEGPAANACEGTSALLRGVIPYPEGSLQVGWFDQEFGGTPLAMGEVFETPVLTQATTWYAEATYTVPVGPKDKNIGENILLDSMNLGMAFEAFTPLQLEAVHVHVDQTGGRFFVLKDLAGETVKSSVKFINETGRQRVELGWDVPPGSYTLSIAGGKPMYVNTSGATYPQSIDGILNITGTTDGQSANGAWYYFYDWEINFREPCGRAPVHVEVSPAGNAPVASFTASADTVNVADNVAIQFENTSLGGQAFFWNLGDGTTSNDATVSHTYQQAGHYIVSFVATSADGCTDAATRLVVVEETTLSGTTPTLPNDDNVAVFPNPVRDQLTVHLDLTTAQPVTLRLLDTSGRTVRLAEHAPTQQGKLLLLLPVADLPEGIYFLTVLTGGSGSVWKVVKL